ncbi:hypothetical protein AB0H83_01930 [Dactylosporangium sp. NPDC050688]|uniref:hypothetical protein n=1 Tax=Dactylosporangium sp. NPDC050688 TaxID=3157217 RepID=UPI0033D7C909
MSDHDYRRWRLPQLWQMLAADHPAGAHLHLATLRRQQTALETQRDRLRALRDQLAVAWPPEKSEAAMAFIQQVNDMIDAIVLTARGAGELRANLVHVTDAIVQARAEMEPLVADYERAGAAADPRVTANAQRLLDDRARRILVTADATVAEALGKLDVPLPSYSRFSWDRREESSSTTTTTSSGGAIARGGSSVRTVLPSPRFDPPAPVIEPDRTGLGGPEQDGFGLTGLPQAADPGGSAPGVHPNGVQPGVRSVTASGGLVLHGPGGLGEDPAAAVSRTVPVQTTGRPFIGSPHAGRLTPAAEGTRRRDSHDAQAETWSVREGVAPVITRSAAAHRDHDPGPGVLGIDR